MERKNWILRVCERTHYQLCDGLKCHDNIATTRLTTMNICDEDLPCHHSYHFLSLPLMAKSTFMKDSPSSRLPHPRLFIAFLNRTFHYFSHSTHSALQPSRPHKNQRTPLKGKTTQENGLVLLLPRVRLEMEIRVRQVFRVRPHKMPDLPEDDR